MTYALECLHLKKSYAHVPVVRDVSLVVRPGEFMTLLGPSGCGKTTTLRLVAGFETLDEGTIRMGGRTVASASVNLPAEQRHIGMVFQEYALFPHLSVGDNIAFGLNGKKAEKAQRIEQMLALVGLEGLAGRMPYELSGGQQQRIALARALAPHPALLLLDEPFSNLDASLRAQVRREVRDILKKAGITCLFVTHDQEEALSLSDQVAVMFDGEITQMGTPQEVYMQPVSREVASFVGEANFLPGDAQGDTVICSLGTLPLRRRTYGPVDLMLRPEAVRIHLDENGPARVESVDFFGHDQIIRLVLDDGSSLEVRTLARTDLVAGMRVRLDVRDSLVAFAAT